MKKNLAVFLIIFSALFLNASSIFNNADKIYDPANYILLSNKKNYYIDVKSNDLEKQADPFYGDPFIKNEDNGD